MTQETVRVGVRPLSSKDETRNVLFLIVFILVAAGAYIYCYHRAPVQSERASWEISARDELNAAEQGINADLLTVLSDISFAFENSSPLSPEAFAAEGISPFLKDKAWENRGGHIWSLIPEKEGLFAYFGQSSFPETSGSFLLVLKVNRSDFINIKDKNGDKSPELLPGIWISHGKTANHEELTDDYLIAYGWKKVVTP